DENQVGIDVRENPVFLSQLPTENTLFGFGLGNPDPQSLEHTDQVISTPVVDVDNISLGTLEVSEGLAFGGTIINNVARAWMMSAGVAVLVSGMVGWMVSQGLVSPLTALIGVTYKMAEGDLSTRAEIKTRDELAVLGEAFNAMADKVEDIIAALRRFVADAAHELHTPITTLGVNLELAKNEDDNLPKYLANAQSQTARLQTLVDNMLDLSRIEAGSSRPTQFSLCDLLRQIEEKCSQEAMSKNISLILALDCSDEKFIYGDLNQIRRAIENLVDNALKFTPNGGEVSIKLTANERFSHLIIQDTGIGIPTKDLPNIYKRFHRGRNAAAYPGSGLGLAIVKAIFDQHGADIKITSDPSGTTVTVKFPKTSDALT
ncbi:MAG: sensor histidine kinase, partial [Candidatus Hermodarchaeia archaeon]